MPNVKSDIGVMVLLPVPNVNLPVLNVPLKLPVLNVKLVTLVLLVINVLLTVPCVQPKINVIKINVLLPLSTWKPPKLVPLKSLVLLLNMMTKTSVKTVVPTV